MEYILYGQLKLSQEKNLSLYLSIGAWFVIALVTLAHSKFEWPKNLSYEPSLTYKGLIRLLLSLYNSRKCHPFRSKAWKIIFHVVDKPLHSFFMLKFHDDLHR